MSKFYTRNGYIDFLKFIFSLAILGVHTSITGFEKRLVFCGYLGVDFFL